MSSMDDDKIFSAEAIRDTNEHISAESYTDEFSAKTIFVENGHDQSGAFQLQGAIDSVWVSVGSSFNIAATTNDYRTVTDYFPKFRIAVTYATAPTTGSLDLHILKTG